MRRFLPFGLLLVFVAAACSVQPAPPTASPAPLASSTLLPSSTSTPLSSPVPVALPTLLPSATPQVDVPTLEPSPAVQALVPNFEHIVILIFENKEYGTIIGNKSLPNFNEYAKKYTLLDAHYAIRHPSLPNYLALIGGDTFGVKSDCTDCYVDATSLPDLIESSGRTWRTYQERMPSACYLGDAFKYAQKHNPFIYFTPVRENAERCKNSIVPFTQLESDLAAKTLPNFVFITPDLCNSSHDSGDCPPRIADTWLGTVVPKLQNYLESDGQPYLILLTWDEGQGDHSCCGLPKKAGGRVATVLISPQVKPGFQDKTPYTHYSILKTISAAWHLPYLGHAADAENVLILAPWK
jgi:phospholipase C